MIDDTYLAALPHPSIGGDAARVLVARPCYPAIPTSLADHIADAVLDVPIFNDDRAIVQVEVAVFGNHRFANGRAPRRVWCRSR